MSKHFYILAGTLLNPKPNKTIETTKNCYLEIKDGLIKSIFTDASLLDQSLTLENWSHLTLLPGLINGHCHLPMSLLKGKGDDQNLQVWLEKIIFPLEAKLVSPEFCQIGTQLSILEMISTGTTTVCDMYYFADTIAQTLIDAKMRSVVGESVINFPVPDDLKKDGSNYKILDRLRELSDTHSIMTPALAPHAPYTCSNELLMEAHQYARQHNLPITIHVSETQKEVSDSKEQFNGLSPIERLHDIGFMEGGIIIAHGVHLSQNDQKLIKDSDSSVIYNPESNMKLGSGIAPIIDLMEKGIKVGLGTDGSASNNDLNLITEMNTGSKLQKLFAKESSSMSAEKMIYLATLGGAEALRIEKTCGSIEPGKAADIIALDLHSKAHTLPCHDPISTIVYSCQGNEVVHSLCQGEFLMKNNQFKTLNKNEVISNVKEYVEKNI